MTITAVNTDGNNFVGGSPYTMGFTPTMGNRVVVTLSSEGAASSSWGLATLTDGNAVPFTKRTSYYDTTQSIAVEIWDMLVPASPSNQLDFTWTTSLPSDSDIGIVELHGSTNSPTFESAATPTTGTSASAVGPTQTPSENGDCIIQAVTATAQTVSSVTASPAWTSLGFFGGLGRYPGLGAYLIETTATAAACTFTLSASTNWAVIGAVYTEGLPPAMPPLAPAVGVGARPVPGIGVHPPIA